MDNEAIAPYAPVIIKLLQRTVYYSDTETWELMLARESAVRSYLGQIGLQLHLDETDGYAFVTQPEVTNDGEEIILPRLVRRTPVSYGATLLCVLLRERLQKHYARGEPGTRLILSKTDLYEMMELFYEASTDQLRLEKIFDRYIRQVENLGFLRELRGPEKDRYEVLPVLRAKISADILVDIKNKLAAHATSNA